MACIAGKITGIPVIATIHGRTRYDLRSGFSRRCSDRLIYVSQFVMSQSARFPEIKYKSVMIPNSVLIPTEKSDRDLYSFNYISRIDKKHSSVIILIINKVLPSLLEDFPMITFNIVGEGDYMPDVKMEAARFNSESGREVCIIFGFQSEVKRIIQKSGLVMGVGRVAIESMACGVPVLSVNQKHLGIIISRDNYSVYKTNNFIAVNNPVPEADKLFVILKDYFSNMKFWQEESHILQSFVNEDFSIKKISVKTESVYKTAFESKNDKKKYRQSAFSSLLVSIGRVNRL
jgi:glycosyltransferase involved in cell wall biosynthesis